MKKMKSGFIGFVPRDGDYLGTLKTYANIGYKAVEGVYARPEEDISARLAAVRDMGLEIVTIATNVQGDANPDAKELIAKANTVGVKRVTMYSGSLCTYRFGGRSDLPQIDELKKEMAKMEALAKTLDDEGIALMFHNHDVEFKTCYNGVPFFWMMANECAHLKFELDIGWVQYAGVDPATLISQLGKRISVLHVKDYIRGINYHDEAKTNPVPLYAAPGTGVLDLQGCFEAASPFDIEYAVIEQDRQHILTQEESVRAGYYNMKETGYVE